MVHLFTITSWVRLYQQHCSELTGDGKPISLPQTLVLCLRKWTWAEIIFSEKQNKSRKSRGGERITVCGFGLLLALCYLGTARESCIWESLPLAGFDWQIKLTAASGWAGRQRRDFRTQGQGDQRGRERIATAGGEEDAGLRAVEDIVPIT